MNPVISVILPAYNSEAFLAKAIQSVLDQSFSKFELIIINDGSTDNTAAIVRSFTDPRIVYHENEKNSGLIYTLNKGIELAKGQYIARMDADDICMPSRLHQQYFFLEDNPAVGVVACTISMIDEQGQHTGIWELDRKTISHKAIKRTMLKENCVAHPTVMARAEFFRHFQYKPYQLHIEDYDLWLRMLIDGTRFAKIEIPLLLYRVHNTSITMAHLKKKNPYFKFFHMKRKLLAREKKFNGYVVLLFFYMLRDGVLGIGKYIKPIILRS